MIPLFWPQNYKEEWLEELEKTFSTRWLGQGPRVEEFEKAFGEKFGYEYCIAVNSGSSALELAYHLVGIEEFDNVITPVLTCTATNIPLLRRKANILFTDVGDNLVIDFWEVYKKISFGSNQIKAIVAVTLGGLPIDERIFLIAREAKIPVIIDAAQSLGVSEKDGDYICYSFQAIKHFTCGDGGMLVVRDKETYERAKRLRWFGIDRELKKRNDWRCMVNHQMAQEIDEAGYKFHMNDISATMGIVGLRHSDEILEYRKTLCERYVQNLKGYVHCIYGGSYWLFAILAKNREFLIDRLRNNRIECDLVQLRNDAFKAFGGLRNLPNMERLQRKYLYLPLNCKVTLDDVDYISGRIIQANIQLAYFVCDRCNKLHFINEMCE